MTKILMLDLETTGLDTKTDAILELGAILYDLEKMEEVEVFGPYLIRENDVRFRPMDPFVYKMHEKSGLFKDIEDCNHRPRWSNDVRYAQSGLLSALVKHGLGRGECMLAGFSVHFDREFLKRDLPLLEGFLSHRHIDASVLKQLSKAWGKEWPKTEAAHRTLPDCREAIETLKLFRPAIMSVEPPAAPVT